MPIKLGSVEVGIDNPPIDTKTYGRKDGAWIDLASAAALQFRQGTNADRLAMDPVPASGEPIYVTDNYRLFIGDGTTTGGRGLVGDTASYVICQPGDDLQAKYTQAKSLEPGGSALSATNRGAVIIFPGVYDVGSSGLDVDEDYVDLLALGSSTWSPSVRITATGPQYQITYAAEDVRVVGLSSDSCQAESGGDKRLLLNCGAETLFYALDATAPAGGFPPVVAGTIVGCVARYYGSDLFGFLGYSTASSIFTGTVENCLVGGRAFTGAVFRGNVRRSAFLSNNYAPFEGALQGRIEYCAFPNRTTANLAGESEVGGNVVGAYGSTATISNASPAVVTENAHGLLTGMAVQFTTDGALPAGLTASTTYFVKRIDANTFSVSATLNGSLINTSSAGSGTHTIVKPPGKDGGWYSYCTTSDGEYTTT